MLLRAAVCFDNEMPCIPALLRIAEVERLSKREMSSIDIPCCARDLSFCRSSVDHVTIAEGENDVCLVMRIEVGNDGRKCKFDASYRSSWSARMANEEILKGMRILHDLFA